MSGNNVAIRRTLQITEDSNGQIRVLLTADSEPTTCAMLLGMLEIAKDAILQHQRQPAQPIRQKPRNLGASTFNPEAIAARLGIPVEHVPALMQEAHEETMREMAEEMPAGENVDDAPTPSRNL